MINWKVRFKNKLFWLALIPAILIVIQAILAVFGIAFDYTEINGKLSAIVTAVFGLLGVLGIVTDHTPEGFGDSQQVMEYETPRGDDDEQI